MMNAITNFRDHGTLWKGGLAQESIIDVHNIQPIFVIQQHQGMMSFYSFKLVVDGVLKTWTLKERPDQVDSIVMTPVLEQPLSYIDFEGVMPHCYGGGLVSIWDTGIYTCPSAAKEDEEFPIPLQLAHGYATLTLFGKRMKGTYILERLSAASTAYPLWKLRKSKETTKGVTPLLENAPMAKVPPQSA
ncbi:DNA polymerase ligase N-terminal domain-containing protein [Zhouia sp. PK063]|uniref:DNA polymerase ligase N-terminal domain-containing protein n=1 Tax=Zhouia sp. PK063 TaxID=3373602 RepID=UPI00378B043D